MEPHEDLILWAAVKGVKLNGITPKRIPGRGVGIVATRAVKLDQILLEVPTPCLRSIDTVPKTIVRKLPKDISVHGLLAADLALDTSDKYSIWNAVCPSPADLASMPLLWPPSLQDLLPSPAKELLTNQQAKFARSWASVTSAFPDLRTEEGRRRYEYAWLLANTRTFYYLSPKLRRRQKDDRMVLQPVADLFNHADGGCNVAFDAASFVVKADRAYRKGEEVRICYGRHGGDFLMVEYGFVLEENCWDEVGLDEVVLPRLMEGRGKGKGAERDRDKWKERLEGAGFWGGYTLDRETVCHRTQVALRTLCCGVGEWKRFVDGEDGGEESQGKVNGILAGLLEGYRGTIEERIKGIEGIKEGEECQRNLLSQRWRHINRLIKGTVERLKGEEDGDS
ncbi:SET domain-containing protein [Xylariales sp. AK1849]|nr:SET domain-containing protein [Xylariales sp. AK1849]